MSKRSSPKSKVNINDPAVRAILAALLVDFKSRKLSAEALRASYEGPSPTDLRDLCCAASNFSEVDYDLAFDSLMKADYVKTGPMKPYPNSPNSGVLIFALVSENKYSYLTEIGYQEANRIRPVKEPVTGATQRVHISGGIFHNSPIGIGHGLSQTLNLSAATADQLIERLREEVKIQISDQGRQKETLERIDALQEAADKPTRLERYMQVMGAIGDHITVLSFILTPLMQALQQ